jgi:pseudouridine synthase
MDLLPRNLPRLFPVGRLDFRTEGLLLLTNDGPLAYRLLHPRFHVPKTYQVKVEGLVDPSSLRLLLEGVGMGRERMRADEARVLRRGPRHTWLTIEVRQGKYHQIRRMCEAIGHPVMRLRRISFGPLQLKGLPPGKWRRLRGREVESLRRQAALSMLGREKETRDR